MDPRDIRQKLAERLENLLGDGGWTSAYWDSTPTAPGMMVAGTPAVDYAQVGEPKDDSEIELVVIAFAGLIDEEVSQDLLESWKANSGETSVRSFLEARDDDGGFLDGLAYDVTVVRAGENQIYDLPGLSASVLGCEFVVRVKTSG